MYVCVCMYTYTPGLGAIGGGSKKRKTKKIEPRSEKSPCHQKSRPPPQNKKSNPPGRVSQFLLKTKNKNKLTDPFHQTPAWKDPFPSKIETPATVLNTDFFGPPPQNDPPPIAPRSGVYVYVYA